MDDLDGNNDIDENLIYGESLPLEKSIHHINEDIGYSRWRISNVLFCHKINYHCRKLLENIIICVVLLFGTLYMFVVIWY